MDGGGNGIVRWSDVNVVGSVADGDDNDKNSTSKKNIEWISKCFIMQYRLYLPPGKKTRILSWSLKTGNALRFLPHYPIAGLL